MSICNFDSILTFYFFYNFFQFSIIFLLFILNTFLFFIRISISRHFNNYFSGISIFFYKCIHYFHCNSDRSFYNRIINIFNDHISWYFFIILKYFRFFAFPHPKKSGETAQNHINMPPSTLMTCPVT